MSESVTIGARKLKVWPEKQSVIALDDPCLRLADCEDLLPLHEPLARRILALEQDPTYAEAIFRGACGVKIRHVDRWGMPAADLLHRRAKELFRRVLGVQDAVVDASWASIYRKGDYCMPHSHVRCIASIVYMLEPGDDNPDDPVAGKFCLVDPRLPICCPHERDRMTICYMPDMRRGTMLIFPAELVHSVNPYMGERPRITMSWNLHTQVIPGSRDTFGNSRNSDPIPA